MENDYYVYVFIDPRDFREFYYGMGRASRKDQKGRNTDTDKIIQEIEDAGEFHLTRVVAKGLTKEQALLVEKTLLWKLGHGLTNISSGHFSTNFRPEKTMNKELAEFDYQNRVFFLNVDEGPCRNWEDWRKYGFISAGQDYDKWGSKVYSFKKGDIICAYQAGFGYVGIAEVLETACEAKKFIYNGDLLFKIKDELNQPDAFGFPDGKEEGKDGEHFVKVKWIKSVSKDSAKRKDGIFYYRSVRCSLNGRPELLEYLENEFDISFEELLKKV